MFLKRVKLANFRSFDDAHLELQRDLTVLVGENNGGKSNAIDAIRLLTLPLGGRREIYCPPMSASSAAPLNTNWRRILRNSRWASRGA
jgi:recombinational DNA repair ATPase RecF